mmetsp:Transcript_27901/g.34643  ORF Transcript_27901/g.34643 Transcript_27901/m.34643 type:complete len:161 (-) Transcript_27901:4147-4629(-)
MSAEQQRTKTRITFSDNKIVLVDPVTKKKKTTLINTSNTLGRLDCISKDSSKCTIDNVKMMDDASGDFAADMQLPTNLQDEINEFKQNFVSMNYAGRNFIGLDEDTNLEDLFNKDTDEDDDEWLFPDGDDGKYIDDDEDGEQFEMPWEFLDPLSRRNRRL